MILLNNKPIPVTLFPDNTSQVWKIKNLQIKNEIKWYYENEREIILLAQLSAILAHSYTEHNSLYIPYLPYARQDKVVLNDSTCALHIFLTMLDAMMFDEIRILDPHNPEAVNKNIGYETVKLNYDFAVPYDFIVFPDKGASERYMSSLFPKFAFDKKEKKIVICHKKRNQETGEIEETEIPSESIKGHGIIVDDICDGGRTFIKLAAKIGAEYREIESLSLYVTHGIFSNGFAELEKHFKKIHTTNSRNKFEWADLDLAAKQSSKWKLARKLFNENRIIVEEVV